MSIPRKSDKKYSLFAVAHFTPFGIDKPFPGSTTAKTFNSIEFSPRHLQTMDNEQARESRAMTRALHGAIESGDVTNIDPAKTGNRKSRDIQAELLVNVMRECHWVSNERKEHGKEAFDGDERQYPEPTSSQLSAWLASIKRQENEVMAKRRNAANPSLIQPSASDTTYVPATEALNQKRELSSVTESVHAVAEEFGLNEKQRIVYNIVARKFVDGHILKVADGGKPLRMLMTGPGGTGKTHAVRALQKLMALHNLQHLIRFLGPTGSSAKQIGGTTIHKGLGLSIALKSKGRGNRKPGESNEDYSATINVKNRTLIREEWRDVWFLFIDEVSLLGAQLMCQIDHALRFAKGNPNEWFGGINVIFAGDFYQYPPVGSTPLYTPIQQNAPQKSTDIEKRLGRLAWKSVNVVVSLSEQQRMKDDRVVKSVRHPNGLDMTGDREKATMLVGTNFIRECAAQDLVDGSEPTPFDRKCLLGLNLADFSSEGALPGLIPLYVGMPVILRNRNISSRARATTRWHVA